MWVDHLRAGDPALGARLQTGEIATHPLVVSEIALGALRARPRILGLLDALPAAPVVETAEIRALIEARALHGRGVGYVHVALLASCLLSKGHRLWTRDRRSAAAAAELGVEA